MAVCDRQSLCNCLSVGCVLWLMAGIPKDLIVYKDGFLRTVSVVVV